MWIWVIRILPTVFGNYTAKVEKTDLKITFGSAFLVGCDVGLEPTTARTTI